MERNKQVDIIRGGAILLVVLEHALGTSDNFLAKIILSFHMPVFFILSGYLAHEKITGDFEQINVFFSSLSHKYLVFISDKEKSQETINTTDYIGNSITFV